MSFLAWFRRVDPFELQRPDGQSCATCAHWIDHSDPNDPQDDDDIQYCGELVDRLGLAEALKQNEYGGHWAHKDSWCDGWQGGPKLWVKDEASS